MQGVCDPPQLKSCFSALYIARKYSENSKHLKTLFIEKCCFMNREYIRLDEMSWCKGSIVTRSTKVCYPCGRAAMELSPKCPPPRASCFQRNPLAVLAVLMLSALQSADVL